MQDGVIRPFMEQLAAHRTTIAASSLTLAEEESLNAELHYHFVANVDFYVRSAPWPRDVRSPFMIIFLPFETPKRRSALRGLILYSFLDASVRFMANKAFSNRHY